jgi:LPXTG-motif cell wall-anchored protein
MDEAQWGSLVILGLGVLGLVLTLIWMTRKRK